MVPADARAHLLLAAIAHARRQPLVLAFSDDDRRRDLRRLLGRVRLRLDVDELEQLEAIELLLARANLLPAVDVAWLERELATDDVLADAADAGHRHVAEVRERSRLRVEDQRGLLRRLLYLVDDD